MSRQTSASNTGLLRRCLQWMRFAASASRTVDDGCRSDADRTMRAVVQCPRDWPMTSNFITSSARLCGVCCLMLISLRNGITSCFFTTQQRLDELHWLDWLDVSERVTFKLGLMTYRCLHGQAPRYLADHVTPAIEVASRHRLIVPRCRLNTYGRRAFPVAGPTVWNPLPDELRDPACDVDSFKQFFKTILFSSY